MIILTYIHCDDSVRFLDLQDNHPLRRARNGWLAHCTPNWLIRSSKSIQPSGAKSQHVAQRIMRAECFCPYVLMNAIIKVVFSCIICGTYSVKKLLTMKNLRQAVAATKTLLDRFQTSNKLMRLAASLWYTAHNAQNSGSWCLRASCDYYVSLAQLCFDFWYEMKIYSHGDLPSFLPCSAQSQGRPHNKNSMTVQISVSSTMPCIVVK